MLFRPAFAFVLAFATLAGSTSGCVDGAGDDPELASEELEIELDLAPDEDTCLTNTGTWARQTAVNNYILNSAITACSGFTAFGGFQTTRSCSGGGRFGYGARVVYNPGTGCAHGVARGALGSAENAIHARWNASGGGNGADLLGGPTGDMVTVSTPAGAPKRYYQYFDSSALAVGAVSAPTTAYAVGGYHAAAGPAMRSRWALLGSNRQFPIENTSCDSVGRCILALEPDGAGMGARLTKHTSSTSAYVVTGSFFTAWDAVARTVWGWPITDRTSDGTLRSYQRFHNGGALASSTGGTTVRRLDGALGTKWFAVRGTTGYPSGGTVVTSNNGRGVQLADGSKLYLEAGQPNAFRVRGVILQKYVASTVWKTWFDAPGGAYGYPLGDEIANGLGDFVQIFRGGSLDASSTCSTSLCYDPSHVVGSAQANTLCESDGSLMTCQAWGTASGDADLDEIPDALEEQLIARFRPELRHGWWTDYYQAYGTDAFNTLAGMGGRYAPAVVRFVSGTSSAVSAGTESWRGWNCGAGGGQPDGSTWEDKRCIEIIYTLPYNWDKGDPETPDSPLAHSHRGDSEAVAVLVARRDPYSWETAPTWGTNWSIARTDVSRWRMMRRWASAHHDTAADSSAGDVGPVPGGYTSTANLIFSSNNKHGSYFSLQACDAGGAWFDDCADNVGPVFLDHANAGEKFVHGAGAFDGTVIEYPGEFVSSRAGSDAPADYEMWGGAAFGESTAYADIMAPRFLDWAYFNTFLGGRSPDPGP